MKRTFLKLFVLVALAVFFLLGIIPFDPTSPYGPVSLSRSLGEDDAQPKGADPERSEEQDKLVLARIRKDLGDKEEGHFILVLKKSAEHLIAPTTRLPPNARKSGGKWQEIVFQVEVLEGRQAATEFLLDFAAFAKEPTPDDASYDWKLAKHVEDPKAAQLEFKKARATADRKSVTRRPRTKNGMTFFFRGGAPKPFQGPRKRRE